jgi:hypothetical protein
VGDAVIERPILFSDAMVQAILDGRKTQTRRLVKPQPPTQEAVRARAGDGYDWEAVRPGSAEFWPVGPVWAVRNCGGSASIRCPYGAAGDRLWVREAWNAHALTGAGEPVSIHYRAGGPGRQIAQAPNDAWWHEPPRWTPSIHMPRWASRLTLEVVSVRVERLHAITEDDAKAEGAELVEPFLDLDAPATYRDGFAALWTRINHERAPWLSNPWVWVVEFRRVTA